MFDKYDICRIFSFFTFISANSLPLNDPNDTGVLSLGQDHVFGEKLHIKKKRELSICGQTGNDAIPVEQTHCTLNCKAAASLLAFCFND